MYYKYGCQRFYKQSESVSLVDRLAKNKDLYDTISIALRVIGYAGTTIYNAGTFAMDFFSAFNPGIEISKNYQMQFNLFLNITKIVGFSATSLIDLDRKMKEIDPNNNFMSALGSIKWSGSMKNLEMEFDRIYDRETARYTSAEWLSLVCILFDVTTDHLVKSEDLIERRSIDSVVKEVRDAHEKRKKKYSFIDEGGNLTSSDDKYKDLVGYAAAQEFRKNQIRSMWLSDPRFLEYKGIEKNRGLAETIVFERFAAEFDTEMKKYKTYGQKLKDYDEEYEKFLPSQRSADQRLSTSDLNAKQKEIYLKHLKEPVDEIRITHAMQDEKNMGVGKGIFLDSLPYAKIEDYESKKIMSGSYTGKMPINIMNKMQEYHAKEKLNQMFTYHNSEIKAEEAKYSVAKSKLIGAIELDTPDRGLMVYDENTQGRTWLTIEEGLESFMNRKSQIKSTLSKLNIFRVTDARDIRQTMSKEGLDVVPSELVRPIRIALLNYYGHSNPGLRSYRHAYKGIEDAIPIKSRISARRASWFILKEFLDALVSFTEALSNNRERYEAENALGESREEFRRGMEKCIRHYNRDRKISIIRNLSVAGLLGFSAGIYPIMKLIFNLGGRGLSSLFFDRESSQNFIEEVLGFIAGLFLGEGYISPDYRRMISDPAIDTSDDFVRDAIDAAIEQSKKNTKMFKPEEKLEINPILDKKDTEEARDTVEKLRRQYESETGIDPLEGDPIGQNVAKKARLARGPKRERRRGGPEDTVLPPDQRATETRTPETRAPDQVEEAKLILAVDKHPELNIADASTKGAILGDTIRKATKRTVPLDVREKINTPTFKDKIHKLLCFFSSRSGEMAANFTDFFTLTMFVSYLFNRMSTDVILAYVKNRRLIGSDRIEDICTFVQPLKQFSLNKEKIARLDDLEPIDRIW